MRLVPFVRVVLLAAAAAAAARPAPAQRPSAWTSLSVPGGVNAANLIGLGKLVHYSEGGQLHVYSAFTRTWQALQVSPTAMVRRANDWVLVRDGATWAAYGASRGRFDAITVSAGAYVVNPATQNNDSVLLVLDGNVLHAFSGFTGRWLQRPVTANASFAVERHVALLHDGARLAAFDGYTGQWHDRPVAAAATSLSASGTAGVAVVGGTAHAFSALLGTWTSAPLPGNASMTRGHDWVAWVGGTTALGYSSLTGTFATTSPVASANAAAEDLFGVFPDAAAVDAFSAFTGTWAREPIGAGAVLRTSSASALVVDGLRLVGYSPAEGRFVPLALDSAVQDLAGAVIAAQDRATGHPYLFSALTAQWTAAPADALPQLPRLATTAALLPTTTGFRAFSARSGAFVPLATGSGVPELNANSAPALVWDHAHLHCFDARLDRWLSLPLAQPVPPTVSIWRTGALVLDGNDAIAFATQSGNVERLALPGPALGWRANSESVAVAAANDVFGFSSLPLPTSFVQFPDFRRALVAGATLRMHLRLLPGEVGFLAGGRRAATATTVPGFGEFLLDPFAHAAVLALREPDADRAVFALRTPPSPALRGTALWFQGLVLPVQGSAFLTEGSEVRIQ